MKDFNIWLNVNEENILFILILILLIFIFFKLIIIFYSFRLKFIKKCGLILNYSIFIYFILNIIEEDNDSELYNNVWNIDKMLYSFWIWDYKKMVYDKEIMKKILCNIPEDIKFKIKGVVEDEIILNSQMSWFMLRDEIIKKKYENIF